MSFHRLHRSANFRSHGRFSLLHEANFVTTTASTHYFLLIRLLQLLLLLVFGLHYLLPSHSRRYRGLATTTPLAARVQSERRDTVALLLLRLVVVLVGLIITIALLAVTRQLVAVLLIVRRAG